MSFKSAVAFALALSFVAPIPVKADLLDLPGYDRMDVPARHRAQPLAVSLWYPAGRATYPVTIGENVIFSGEKALVGAAVADGRHPLVLLSHGSGGAMDGLAWLSARLARRGAIYLPSVHGMVLAWGSCTVHCLAQPRLLSGVAWRIAWCIIGAAPGAPARRRPPGTPPRRPCRRSRPG